MTDEVKSPVPAAEDPLAKAVSNGYVEPQPVPREERVKTLIADIEHAMASNAPMTPALLAEVKDLIGFVAPVAEQAAAVDESIGE